MITDQEYYKCLLRREPKPPVRVTWKYPAMGMAAASVADWRELFRSYGADIIIEDWMKRIRKLVREKKRKC